MAGSSLGGKTVEPICKFTMSGWKQAKSLLQRRLLLHPIGLASRKADKQLREVLVPSLRIVTRHY